MVFLVLVFAVDFAGFFAAADFAPFFACAFLARVFSTFAIFWRWARSGVVLAGRPRIHGPVDGRQGADVHVAVFLLFQHAIGDALRRVLAKGLGAHEIGFCAIREKTAFAQNGRNLRAVGQAQHAAGDAAVIQPSLPDEMPLDAGGQPITVRPQKKVSTPRGKLLGEAL